MAFLGIPTSKKDLGNNWIAKNAAAGALRTVGAVTPRIGGLAEKRDAYFNTANNITNPTVNYKGIANPVASKPAQPINTGGNGGIDPQTLQAMIEAAGGGGGAYGGGGGASDYDPNKDPAKVQAQRNAIRSMMSTFEQAFNDVLGKVDQIAAQKRQDFETNYAGQQQGLDKNFGTTSAGIDDQYSARNAYHSSYRETAQQQAKDAYDLATTQLGAAKQKDLASVGQFVDQQKAELSASRPTYNVDDYGEVDDLLGIGQDVESAIGKLRTTGAGLGTDSQYIQRLNSITPQQETGSAALKAQLDKLANTPTNASAKRAIAATTIANAGGDAAVWQDYFEKQLQLTGSDANAEQPVLTVQ